jgi:hypothetical protein
MKDTIEVSHKTDWQSIGNWKNGRVRSGAKATIWISLLFGAAFTGISLPGVLAIPDEISNGNPAILVVLLFPLIGLGAFAVFAHALVGWRKFGVSELVLDPVPGSIGGDFGGGIDTRIPWKHGTVVDITLSCQHLRTTGSGKNRSTSTTVVWQREGVATLSPRANGTHISFRFAIPPGLPQSEKASSDHHRWLLSLQCELPGVDFVRSFEVPVFETGTPLRSTQKATYAKDSAPLTAAPGSIVRIEHTADGLCFHYPWHRHWWGALLMILVGGVFAGVGWFIGAHEPGLLFPLVFGGVGAVVLAAGLYLIGNTLTTTVSRNGIRTLRSIYGLRFQRNARRDEILRLERRIGSTMQGGSKNRVFYAIDAHTRDGRRITIADTLEGSRLADFVEARVREALGHPVLKSQAGVALT